MKNPTVDAIELLRGSSLVTLAQQELHQQITSGRLAAGVKLNEQDMAEAMGISRGPIREAFRGLEQAGLVRVEKNRGVFVRQVSLDEALEIYDVRAALEGRIGELAALRIEAEEIAQLRALVDQMAVLDQSTNTDAYFPLNVEFHDRLAQATRNGMLLSTYRNTVTQLDLYRRATLSQRVENIPLSTVEHRAIIHVIESRDQEQARKLMTCHVLQSRERMLQAVSRQAPQ